jgi:ABC-type microcin C transport system permease subunit YejB
MNFLDVYSKNNQILNFMKIRPVGAELFHEDGRTDRQRDMMKLPIAFFCNISKVRNNCSNARYIQRKIYGLFSVRFVLNLFIYIVKIALGVQKAILRLQSAIKHRLPRTHQFLCQLQNHPQRSEKRLAPSD